MDFILGHFKDRETATLANSLANNYFLTAISFGHMKLRKYYKLTNQTYAYYAAILLYPALKKQYLLKKWSDYLEQFKPAFIAIEEAQN